LELFQAEQEIPSWFISHCVTAKIVGLNFSQQSMLD